MTASSRPLRASRSLCRVAAATGSIRVVALTCDVYPTGDRTAAMSHRALPSAVPQPTLMILRCGLWTGMWTDMAVIVITGAAALLNDPSPSTRHPGPRPAGEAISRPRPKPARGAHPCSAAGPQPLSPRGRAIRGDGLPDTSKDGSLPLDPRSRRRVRSCGVDRHGGRQSRNPGIVSSTGGST
jgi:hypothetical protein